MHREKNSVRLFCNNDDASYTEEMDIFENKINETQFKDLL